MSLRRVTSLSSEFLLCLFLKNTINSQQSFCQTALLWSDTLCYLSTLFFVFWNVLKNLQEIKKKKNNHHRKQLTEGPELLLEKQLLLALSLSGCCGRRGQKSREHGSSSQSSAPQKPGRPPASHMTPSPSCVLLGLQVFICENTGLASLRGILGHLNELQ